MGRDGWYDQIRIAAHILGDTSIFLTPIVFGYGRIFMIDFLVVLIFNIVDAIYIGLKDSKQSVSTLLPFGITKLSNIGFKDSKQSDEKSEGKIGAFLEGDEEDEENESDMDHEDEDEEEEDEEEEEENSKKNLEALHVKKKSKRECCEDWRDLCDELTAELAEVRTLAEVYRGLLHDSDTLMGSD